MPVLPGVYISELWVWEIKMEKKTIACSMMLCYHKDRETEARRLTLNNEAISLKAASRHYCSSGGYFFPLKIS